MTAAKEDKRRRIEIDAEYRLLIDTDCVMIERLVTVDPTKAPRFDAAKDDPTPRQVWRNVGKYYATVPRAIEGLLEFKLRNGTAADLREMVDEVKAFRAHVDGLLGAEV